MTLSVWAFLTTVFVAASLVWAGAQRAVTVMKQLWGVSRERWEREGREGADMALERYELTAENTEL